MAHRLGRIDVGFEVCHHGAHIYFDPASQQPLLAFDFTLHVAVPQMLQSLLAFQRAKGFTPPGSGQYKGGEPDVQQPSTVVPAVPAPCPGRPWPPTRRREPPPPPPDSSLALMAMSGTPSSPPDSSMALMAMSGTPTPPPAPGVTPVFAKSLPCMQNPPPAAPPLAPGVTPVFAKHPPFTQAPPPPPPPPAPCVQSPEVKTPPPPPPTSCAQPPEVKAMARISTPQSGFTELVTSCLPHEGPAMSQPIPEIRKPEIVVTHMDEKEVLGIAFGDTDNDKIIFHTDDFIGCFSLQQNQLVSKHKLTLTHLHCRIRCMTVNTVMGHIACLLEAQPHEGDGHFETIITVWPNGVLQEEPLKLRISPDTSATDFMPPAIESSSLNAPLVVVSRVCTQKVFSWRFISTACPSETTVTAKGGLIAISSTGRWLAVVEEDDYGKHHTKVWSYTTHPLPSLVSSLERNPRTMAIAHQGDTVLLALSDGCPMGSTTLPVEVLAIQPDGRVSCTYRLVPESPCKQLSFSIDNPNFMLCVRDDGVVSLHNLLRGTAAMYPEDAKVRSACMSPNCQLILSAYDNLFHVYKSGEHAACVARAQT